MITRLKGQLIEKKPPNLCIDVQGVGYQVLAPMSTIYQLPALEETVILHIHHWIREDAQLLYGFTTQQERELFRELIKINGVGPKMGLTLLSGMSTKELIECIQHKNILALVRLPGVGKKTAERLLVEMNSKLKKLIKIEPSLMEYLHSPDSPQQTLPSATNEAIEDAIDALIALGYENKKVQRIVQQCAEPEMSSEALIRAALKSFV